MTWHSKSYMFSQQTTRESKRRASKEAIALSKDGQPVSINGSGDADPGKVCDERWRQAKTLWGGRWPELGAVHQKTGRGFTEKCADDVCYWLCKTLAVNLSDLQHKHLHMSPSKDLGMLHLCCAIANACVKQESVWQTVCTLSTMLVSHAYGAGQGMCHCVKPILRKQEQNVPYAHDNHNLHINLFSVWGPPKEFASVLCASVFLLLWMKKTIVWEPLMDAV